MIILKNQNLWKKVDEKKIVLLMEKADVLKKIRLIQLAQNIEVNMFTKE